MQLNLIKEVLSFIDSWEYDFKGDCFEGRDVILFHYDYVIGIDIHQLQIELIALLDVIEGFEGYEPHFITYWTNKINQILEIIE